ncbi:MAG: hypothetical protein II150_06725, partial [Thermoguttaceae bacterium]|nr:hypothetical protein [Thermoguttaceae bacterium]
MRTNRIALISAIIVALASQNASFAAPPQRGGPGGGPGREARSIEYRGAATYDADSATQNQTYSSEESEV